MPLELTHPWLFLGLLVLREIPIIQQRPLRFEPATGGQQQDVQ